MFCDLLLNRYLAGPKKYMKFCTKTRWTEARQTRAVSKM